MVSLDIMVIYTVIRLLSSMKIYVNRWFSIWIMNISEAKEKILCGDQLIVEAMHNPADLSEWILWIREPSGKSFLLSSNDGKVIKSSDATLLCHILKEIGFKQATVFFWISISGVALMRTYARGINNKYFSLLKDKLKSHPLKDLPVQPLFIRLKSPVGIESLY